MPYREARPIYTRYSSDVQSLYDVPLLGSVLDFVPVPEYEIPYDVKAAYVKPSEAPALTRTQTAILAKLLDGTDLFEYYSYLTPDQQTEFDDAFPIRERPYSISAPGIEDILHVVPHYAWTDGDSALKKELVSTYGPELWRDYALDFKGQAWLDEYDRRVAVSRQIANSPTPELVQQVAKVATFLDDVNDAAITLGYIYRVIGYRIAKRFPGAAGKIIRGLGLILTVADILDILQVATGRGITRVGLKLATKNKIAWDPKSRGWKILTGKEAGRILPRWAEAIQILQTTDNLFGVGVSLGPVYGFASEVESGGIRSVVPGGTPVTISVDTSDMDIFGRGRGWGAPLYRISQSPTVPLYSRKLTMFDTAALRTLNAAPYILLAADVLDIEDVVNTVATLQLAVRHLTVSPVLDGYLDRLGPAVDLPIPITPPSQSAIQFARDAGVHAEAATAAYPLDVPSPELSVRAQAALLGPAVQAAMNRFYLRHKLDIRSEVVAQMVTEMLPGLLRLVGGVELDSREAVPLHMAPVWALAHHGLAAYLNPDRASLERVYGAILESHFDHPHATQLTYEQTYAAIKSVDGFVSLPGRVPSQLPLSTSDSD